jgi:3-oxoacyl-[acyl-carrier-protein] synthase II
MDPRIHITGLGLVTPLGNTPDQTWSALLAGQFLRDHTRIPEITGPARCAQIACQAAEQAVQWAGWSRQILSQDRTALIVATSKGPIEDWLTGRVGLTGVAEIGSAVARRLGMIASPLTLSAACATGLHALIRAALALTAGECDRALVVAAEASVHPLFISSFARLGVLPPEGHGCRPFDESRQGFIMSEAAAALCLETTGHAIAGIERFAMAGDATNLISSDPQGTALTKILTKVIDNRRVDLLHAHGTGTIQHDPVELSALERAVPSGDSLHVYSHKAALGHSLGAAGLVSIVLNCLAHRGNKIPGNINTPNPLPTRLKISRDPQQLPIRRTLAVASGFGGALAAVSLTSPHA